MTSCPPPPLPSLCPVIHTTFTSHLYHHLYYLHFRHTQNKTHVKACQNFMHLLKTHILDIMYDIPTFRGAQYDLSSLVNENNITGLSCARALPMLLISRCLLHLLDCHVSHACCRSSLILFLFLCRVIASPSHLSIIH